ncbi:MAG: hypothetical protein KAI24_14730 [Planctomycetes bacterium]|nr:hypothetical protein [Planctomycetota bacterium]
MIRMDLRPDERKLVGGWVKVDGRIEADATCRRINWLVGHRLQRVATGDWCVLYRDPGDGRLWELTWPQGQMQGGGPPQLAVIAT